MRGRLEAAGIQDVGTFFPDLIRNAVSHAIASHQLSAAMVEGELSGAHDDNAEIDLGAVGGRDAMLATLQASQKAMEWMMDGL